MLRDGPGPHSRSCHAVALPERREHGADRCQLVAEGAAADAGPPLVSAYRRSIGVTRLESHVAVDNVGSRRVSEKNGFRSVGTFTGDDRIAMIRYQVDLGTI
jgi:hypothetical protein